MSNRRVFLSALALASALSLIGCGSSSQQPQNSGSAPIVSAPPQQAPQSQPATYRQPDLPETQAEFDANGAMALLRQANFDPAQFEQLLNEQGNNVNQLHQADPNKVDYLSVQAMQPNQYGRSFKIFDVSIDPAQEVITLQVPPSVNGNYAPRITFNPVIFGPAYASYVYTPQYSLAEAAAFAILFSPRYHAYYSPYHYGYYAPYYHAYAPMPVTQYRSTVVRRYVTREVPRTASPGAQSAPRATTISQPVQAPTTNRTLTQPQQTQKQFQVRDNRQSVGQGGFGRSSAGSNPSPSSSPPRTSAPRSFGSAGKKR